MKFPLKETPILPLLHSSFFQKSNHTQVGGKQMEVFATLVWFYKLAGTMLSLETFRYVRQTDSCGESWFSKGERDLVEQ